MVQFPRRGVTLCARLPFRIKAFAHAELKGTRRGLKQARRKGYFLAGAAAIWSITRACEPPRSYSFPLATTRPPANSRSRLF